MRVCRRETQYRSRQLFTEMERVNNEAHRLDVEFERLQVEKRAQATPLRVEKLAKEQLKMTTTTPAITLYVRQDGSVIPAVVSAAPPLPTNAGAPARKGH